MSDAKIKGREASTASRDTAGKAPSPPHVTPSPAHVVDDHLATIRLPPISQAPVSPAAASAAASAAAPLPPVPRPPSARGSIAPPPAPSGMPKNDRGLGSDIEPSRPRSSWLHSLMDPGLPAVSTAVERLRQRRVGAACLVAAVVFVVVGLVVGLSAPPAESVLSPAVLGAVVIARAIMALGIVSIGVALLRIGVNWLLVGLSRPPSSAEGR